LLVNDFRKNVQQIIKEAIGLDTKSLYKTLVDMAKQWGGKVYLVGGAVRDQLMGTESKDLDFVVTKIEKDDLQKELLKALPGSTVNEAGTNFGIVIVNIGDDQLEFALPRKDFDRQTVIPDPNIPIEQDLLRRDYTFNALAQDLETGEIINAVGENGKDDIKNGIIRAVGNPKDRFNEDPLRILRGIQFASRFGFEIEPETLRAMKIHIDDLQKVSSERFREEFNKAWTKGKADTQKFFDIVKETGMGQTIFGSDFNPIPVDTKKSKHPFISQLIGAFINGGDFTKVILSKDDQQYVHLARTLKDVIDNGLKMEHLDKFKDKAPLFAVVQDAFNLIDKTLSVGMKKLLEKPLIVNNFPDDNIEPFVLPLRTGDVIRITKESGNELKGKAISEAIKTIIMDYQNGKIPFRAGKHEKNKEYLEKYIKDVILKESSIQMLQKVNVITERIRHILD
jgi:tRNA nucleotidyltransferase/poly(A) polymerase